jgi:hypothetical protein
MSEKGKTGKQLAAENRKLIRVYYMTHLCATQKDCANALGLGVMAVSRHAKAIRAEWKK